MPIIIKVDNHSGQRWHVRFMIRSPADHVFLFYRLESPSFPGNTPMERIDMWAEAELMAMQKRVPETQFSYRLEHW